MSIEQCDVRRTTELSLPRRPAIDEVEKLGQPGGLCVRGGELVGFVGSSQAVGAAHCHVHIQEYEGVRIGHEQSNNIDVDALDDCAAIVDIGPHDLCSDLRWSHGGRLVRFKREGVEVDMEQSELFRQTFGDRRLSRA